MYPLIALLKVVSNISFDLLGNIPLMFSAQCSFGHLEIPLNLRSAQSLAAWGLCDKAQRETSDLVDPCIPHFKGMLEALQAVKRILRRVLLDRIVFTLVTLRTSPYT